MYFKFKDNDIYRQTIITYPDFKFSYVLAKSDNKFKIILNDSQSGSGKALSLDSQMRNEVNINTEGSELIYPFIDKTSGKYWTSNVNSASYYLTPLGVNITGTYMVKPVLYINFMSSTQDSIYKSLINIWETQKNLNSQFSYSNFPSGCSIHIFPRDYYGSGIKKGSVKASISSVYNDNFSIFNSFIAEDIYKDGILRITEDSFPTNNVESNVGKIVGYVLYDYGIVVFKSASMLYYTPNESTTSSIKYSNTNFDWSSGSYGTEEDRSYYNWRWFGDKIFCDEVNNSTIASLEFKGINKIQNITMMCHAPKGKLNNSTNPTFLEYSQSIHATQSSEFSLVENSNIYIKNIVSSSYNVEEEFDKRTIISHIFILDDQKKILAVASLANPSVKKENSDITFKLSKDL